MNSVLLLAAHGIGDQMLAFQCREFIPFRDADIISCSRNETFSVLSLLYNSIFSRLSQHPLGEKWGENNWILSNQETLEELKKKYSEIYYIIPDLLFRNPLAFDYRKYNVAPGTIKSTRTLISEWRGANEKRITVNLNSTTPGYSYINLYYLVIYLSQFLPDYEIYVPLVTEWAGKAIEHDSRFFHDKFDKNVIVDFNPKNEVWIEKLKTSCYAIVTDNGVSHIAYHLGCPRLLLDPRYTISDTPWQARWREAGLEESLPISTPPNQVANLVKSNVLCPESALISRQKALELIGDFKFPCWNNILYFKY